MRRRDVDGRDRDGPKEVAIVAGAPSSSSSSRR
jgi:hypothetical protein